MRRGECVGTNRWTSCPTKPRHEGGVTAPVLGMPWYSTGTPSEMVWRKGWVFLLPFPPSFSLVSFFLSFLPYFPLLTPFLPSIPSSSSSSLLPSFHHSISLPWVEGNSNSFPQSFLFFHLYFLPSMKSFLPFFLVFNRLFFFLYFLLPLLFNHLSFVPHFLPSSFLLPSVFPFLFPFFFQSNSFLLLPFLLLSFLPFPLPFYHLFHVPSILLPSFLMFFLSCFHL